MADPRSSSARMIAERMRATAMPPASAHPDADLLTAFAERSLSERERTRVIEHLAHCAVCRDVVYLAQPEMEAPLPATSGSPTPIRWFAWRRLQWAALAASLSLVVALAVLVRENPERGSVLTGRMANEPAAPRSVAQYEAKNDGTASTYAYDSSKATLNEKPERRESLPSAAPEKQERFRAEAKGTLGTSTYDSLARLTSKSSTPPPDDLSKTTNFFSDKETAKQGDFAFRLDEKDKFGSAIVNGNSGVRSANGTVDANGPLFDMAQQKAQSGPYANMNSIQNAGNATTNTFYVDRNVQTSAQAATHQPAPPPAAPVPGPVAATSDLKNPEPKAPADQGAAAGGFVAMARPSAPTRAIVPAEDARKKKLETIPAHATPQGTEETVAVAGKAQDVDSAHAVTSAAVSRDEIAELSGVNRSMALEQLTPGVAPTSAITGWRVRHGRLQGRLYGIWHDLVLRRQPGAADNAVTEISSASEFKVESEANARSAAVSNKAGSVLRGLASAVQRFTAVAKSGVDVWAVEVVSAGRNVSQLVVHHSRDAGVTWQPLVLATQETLKPNLEADIKFKDTQQGEIVLSSGERWQTNDGGAHWSKLETPGSK